MAGLAIEIGMRPDQRERCSGVCGKRIEHGPILKSMTTIAGIRKLPLMDIRVAGSAVASGKFEFGQRMAGIAFDILMLAL
jgi:hypothetical protein